MNLSSDNEDIFGLVLYFFVVELFLKQFTEVAFVSVDKMTILVQENSIIFREVKVLLTSIKTVRLDMFNMKTSWELEFYDFSLLAKFLKVICICFILRNRIGRLA